MSNPIQQVLAAEKAAERDIFQARAAAEHTLLEVQRRLREYEQASEQRLRRAVRRFELGAAQRREARARRVREAAADLIAAQHAEVRSRLPELVEQAFAARCPGGEKTRG